LIGRRFPAVLALCNGEGAIQLQLAATLSPLAAGMHHLRYRNLHRPAISVYLANALVPTSARVVVVAQQRDVDQRGLVIEYLLK
jgi:hypothetical protein